MGPNASSFLLCFYSLRFWTVRALRSESPWPVRVRSSAFGWPLFGYLFFPQSAFVSWLHPWGANGSGGRDRWSGPVGPNRRSYERAQAGVIAFGV